MTMMKRNNSFCADVVPICIVREPWPGDIWGDIFGEDDSDDDD